MCVPYPFSYRSIRNVLYHVNLNHLSHMIIVIINEIINPKHYFFIQNNDFYLIDSSHAATVP